jgi:hypothetical protein
LPQFWNTTDENPKYGTVMNESDFVKYFLSWMSIIRIGFGIPAWRVTF